MQHDGGRFCKPGRFLLPAAGGVCIIKSTRQEEGIDARYRGENREQYRGA